jgi:uncharacterized protein YukE
VMKYTTADQKRVYTTLGKATEVYNKAQKDLHKADDAYSKAVEGFNKAAQECCKVFEDEDAAEKKMTDFAKGLKPEEMPE